MKSNPSEAVGATAGATDGAVKRAHDRPADERRPTHHPDHGGSAEAWAETGSAPAAERSIAAHEVLPAGPSVAGSKATAAGPSVRHTERMTEWLASPEAAGLTEEAARAEIRLLDAPVATGRLAACRAERRVGMLVLALRPRMEASDLPAHHWYRDVLRIPPKRALRAQKLAGAWALFIPANRWLTTVGEREGWAVEAATGAAYALEVIALHRRWQAGEAPADREDRAAARRAEQEAERDADRLAARKDRDAQVAEGAPVGRDRSRADLMRSLEREQEGARQAEEERMAARRDADEARAGEQRLRRRIFVLEAALRRAGLEPPPEEEGPELEAQPEGRAG